ncbi:efflux RND transporter periplasmic adaptor subunit [Roseinatronobacter bogoriensis]|uniref:Efflux RND transporter periplasmic adaptor subunit n=1 Tax=Roseinatronobacter bogoriensis subsp. barguzinensis TaxID=441209 RepID=A0A2K8KH19_9RHOB|nr:MULTISPECIES: efflux RND transporter periplasmic adaptor subunit [Rhodobaca]ATX67293.1 efflux RND transporter periplasmic adaptor subunit [Rhodobaca barguzinensis]MBB4206851.1 RND family efflux transporter MFP subunit [Rhodobaca bogoriensis DSM 18756]TDW41594.1 RND family efflux transporter MFP subunit [Rhodobaca barguzinensis]TDY74227.1 RND family efflux transporter MFP subunit [Rhodobaca bogoriensis DSM 18756]
MTRWIAAIFFFFTAPLAAQTLYDVAPVPVTEWKAIYGRVEAQNLIPARARIGGTLVSLSVSEGDLVTAGQILGEIVDEKLDFQISALDAQLQATGSQLGNAESELVRGEELLARGVTTAQRLDALRTQAEVLRNQIAATQAERRLVEQQATEGRVLAPISGRVLTVPVATGAVVMPGEAVATIGGGGFFLRLAVPERHAGLMSEGDTIRIDAAQGEVEGRLAKLYPQIENGRVIADVEVPALDDAFVDARVLVRLPIDTRDVIAVPEAALAQRFGLDFVTVDSAERVVVPGQRHVVDGSGYIEILSGLRAGEAVVLP